MELVRKIVNTLVADILAETTYRLQKTRPVDQGDISNVKQPIVSFSEELTPTYIPQIFLKCIALK